MVWAELEGPLDGLDQPLPETDGSRVVLEPEHDRHELVSAVSRAEVIGA
jgi:hypothetical protein